MVGSSSAGAAKTTKRTRGVRTLTPSQLARKRANDREAQRAIRARTKEHIEWLERELKSEQSRDQTVQELLRRNKALEDELNRLKENMAISMASSPYSTPISDNLSPGSGAIPRTSPFASGNYNTPPTTVNNTHSSSASADYNAGYIHTSVSTSMVSSNNSNTNVNALSHKDIKLGQPSHAAIASVLYAATAMECIPGELSSGPVLGSLRVLPGGEFWQISVMAIAPACGAELLRAAAASHGSI
ncbi:hypothetical protein MRS44_017963 [Fusarium solani]|uniref:uncharacterized protein n=1 Tax=Fusarium solani TaxID=169388 RepID=UPI0032C44F29|nr:hypothetical protein MRS44_017963 [Fusarium solani]